MNLKVGVVGAGYVGLTTAVCMATKGIDTFCMDIDPARVRQIIERGRDLLLGGPAAWKTANIMSLLLTDEQRAVFDEVQALMTVIEGHGTFVMNRVGADYAEGDISLKKAEETIGKPIFWQIPNDSKPMLGARVNGVPLLQHAPRCKAQQSIAGLARALSGQEDKGTPARARRSLFSFK